MNLCASKWAARLEQHYTERIVVVATTVIVVEIERTCIRAVVVIAPAQEERIASVRKVGVLQFNP